MTVSQSQPSAIKIKNIMPVDAAFLGCCFCQVAEMMLMINTAPAQKSGRYRVSTRLRLLPDRPNPTTLTKV